MSAIKYYCHSWKTLSTLLLRRLHTLVNVLLTTPTAQYLGAHRLAKTAEPALHATTCTHRCATSGIYNIAWLQCILIVYKNKGQALAKALYTCNLVSGYLALMSGHTSDDLSAQVKKVCCQELVSCVDHLVCHYAWHK